MATIDIRDIAKAFDPMKTMGGIADICESCKMECFRDPTSDRIECLFIFEVRGLPPPPKDLFGDSRHYVRVYIDMQHLRAVRDEFAPIFRSVQFEFMSALGEMGLNVPVSAPAGYPVWDAPLKVDVHGSNWKEWTVRDDRGIDLWWVDPDNWEALRVVTWAELKDFSKQLRGHVPLFPTCDPWLPDAGTTHGRLPAPIDCQENPDAWPWLQHNWLTLSGARAA